ncbi:hypothetical protein PAGA_a2627 [Pseudoalteromonas agarivorans DSM 14585]|uniref:Uncharacterized protein n=1 Tax=Pseudoalteromonas agarivorans DSM 14585 TaxID=1312369 RepID=A0ACA8DY14_9GAMM|nr:hypothetical protein PAGA_a2627 [Pseudoalteromonas agarivorans DSM 14585]
MLNPLFMFVYLTTKNFNHKYLKAIYNYLPKSTVALLVTLIMTKFR